MASARKHPVKSALEELEQAIISHQETVTANLQIIFDAYDNAMSAVKNAMAGQVATPQAPPEPVARPVRQERPATATPAPVETAAEPVKRGRGRPPRSAAAQPVAAPVATPAGRGRPRAVPVPVEEPEDETDFADDDFQDDDDTAASTGDDSGWSDDFPEDDDDIPEPQPARGRRGR